MLTGVSGIPFVRYARAPRNCPTRTIPTQFYGRSMDRNRSVGFIHNPSVESGNASKLLNETRYAKLVRYVAIICIVAGVLMRIVYFGSIPGGLNQDEASSGYDAWCLAHYGTEGIEGVPWPVHLISWGDGANASYTYMAMPFVAFGLSPMALRLPMLLSALVSLALVWLIARRVFDINAAWASSAVVAVSPWHIMLSRWALDCNALPFMFLCGLTLLVISTETRRKLIWLIFACVLFGATVYSYGAAYLAVPLFVFGALIICTAQRSFTRREALVGALVFALTALPIALFVLVNFFQWSSIHLGAITIPHLPRPPRFEKQLSTGLLSHIGELGTLVASQRDGLNFNTTDPYGVIYSSVFFCMALGLLAGILVQVARRRWPLTRLLVPLWILVCIPTGIVQEPNINRVNLLLMGLVFSAGLALAEVDKLARGTLIVGLASLLTLSGFFAHDYFTTQRDKLATDFFDGFLPALHYARSRSGEDGTICVTGEVNMPQIYTLFDSPSDSQEYIRTVRYVWGPTERTGDVISYGRYTFGLQRCDFKTTRVVVAQHAEQAPSAFLKSRSFKLFDVYLRR